MMPSDKPRSRRLRKKLHVGEFKELGFTFAAELQSPLTPKDEELLIDRFLAEVVEARALTLCGWITGGFITAYGRGSATDEDREAIQAWLAACPALKNAQVRPLVDAWYDFWYENEV